MSSIVGAITGSGGGGFTASRANLIKPVTDQQLTDQYGNVQTGLTQQQNFLQAVQAQNGLQNQSNTFNQLQGVANGTGPNPAQAQLAQATGANTANQAALMAGQRGSGANAGLIARQASMQGAQNQQNSIGQAATLQANQSLGALNQMSGLATNQANQQAGATNAYTNAALTGQQNLLGAAGAYNNAQVGMASNMNNVNGSMQGQIAGMQGNVLGNLMGAGGSGLMTMMGGPAGAAVPTGSTPFGPNMMKAEGGEIEHDVTPMPENQISGPQSSVGQHFMAEQDSLMPQVQQTAPAAKSSGGSDIMGAVTQALPMIAMMAAKGGRVPVLLSPGEKKLSPQAVEQVKKGANPMAVGKEVPGKPKVGGAKNSYANDTVPDSAEAGSIILPRSVTQSKDPAKEASKFVAAILKRQALKR